MVKKSIIKKARQYAALVAEKFPVKQVILFGSCARGKETEESDIDVGIILKNKPADILKTETEFFKIRRNVDLRIEPLLIDEYRDPSGFFADIRRQGKIVFNAP